jgi:hypothetical protein
MYISDNMADSVALETSTVKVKKELKYYYLHREEILAKKREKREADPKYQEKLQEKEEKKKRAEEEKRKRAEEEKAERAKERARKRAEALGLTPPVKIETS